MQNFYISLKNYIVFVIYLFKCKCGTVLNASSSHNLLCCFAELGAGSDEVNLHEATIRYGDYSGVQAKQTHVIYAIHLEKLQRKR